MRSLEDALWYVPPGRPARSDEYARARAPYLLCGAVPLVARSHIRTGRGAEVEISTVFLHIDHGWGMSSAPILWETMIFGSVLDCEQWRYFTAEEAAKGHVHAVRLAEAELDAAGRVPVLTFTYRGHWHPR